MSGIKYRQASSSRGKPVTVKKQIATACQGLETAQQSINAGQTTSGSLSVSQWRDNGFARH
ncbi:hypothetical protein SG34_009045 [Thalassomonas viridans]|uniref:Uncharacterized protein n=1 Tax=Thalassomonas viridans TaxID=137584 RepID=A0AAE9Z826_9GAMM|nr:hypothetical protein [Thalassomonas viridans]WDE07013.1 hypothetical protein SG34_009045 [Thalassomonas viridans]